MKALRPAAILLQAALAAALCLHPPVGVAAALPLLAPLPWMWRGARKAFAVNSLLLPFYVGFLVAFRGQGQFLLFACLAAAAFVAGLLHLRARPPPVASPR